ncbi:MAG: YgjV family protein [Propionivibrio sp.]|jgi:hypothetical protein|uniref:hypothetical protein n=1 Tax=Propionivibrio sp. TaxID=2212460 RepID=UPI001B5B919D|nr:hypothetical protein [Propionivibrio sp.]MBP7202867.1 YgjV family protein [Propionivibrio sp.]
MFYGISWIEWFGYAASVVVAISLTMSSIVKLRWLNLTGAMMFSTYGFIIGALPVGFLNLFIVVINIVYLVRMYREKDDFRIMRWSGEAEYLRHFLDFHRVDIERFFPRLDVSSFDGRHVFFLVKNAAPIGLLLGRQPENGCFLIELDYVGPQFRDFKMGSFLYEKNDFFRQQGYSTLKAPVTGSHHDAYLARMGFARQGDYFVKAL